jgi:hypothetical protein
MKLWKTTYCPNCERLAQQGAEIAALKARFAPQVSEASKKKTLSVLPAFARRSNSAKLGPAAANRPDGRGASIRRLYRGVEMGALVRQVKINPRDHFQACMSH